MKICIIGCGNHSRHVHGPSYRQYAERNHDVTLSACCDLNIGSAEEYARDFGFNRVYADYQEMIIAESPDAVGIIVPVELTQEITEKVLVRDISCIIEKPPAEDVDGVKRLMDAVAQSGSQLRVAFNRRFMPVIRALREQLILNGEPIQHIDYEMHRVRRYNEDFSTTAIHGIDLVGFVGDSYKSVKITYQDVDGPGYTATNFFLDCMMSGDVTARLSFLPVTGHNAENITVHTSSYTYIAQLPDCLSVYASNQLVKQITPSEMGEGTIPFEVHGFYYEVASFLDELREKGINTQGCIETTLQSVELAYALRNRIRELCL